jgi:hypothetical protein
MNKLAFLAVAIALATAAPATTAMAANLSSHILAKANAAMTPGAVACPTYAAKVGATTTMNLSRSLNCSLSNNASALSSSNSAPSPSLTAPSSSLPPMQPN